jgi:hypothetical protein
MATVEPKPGRLHWGRILVAGMLLAIWGCKRDEQIERYQVPRETRQVVAMPPRSPASSEPRRMLGAIVIHPPKAWFFKATASVKEIESIVNSFEAFIRSLRFDPNQASPEWSLPSGWSQRKDHSPMRFATLDAQDVELSVTSLDAPSDQTDEYILANLNRWRDQLQLPPLTAEQLARNIREIKTDHVTATIMDITGIPSQSAGMQSGGASSAVPDVPDRDSHVAAQWKVPSTWKADPPKPMRLASYQVLDGRAEVSVVGLGPAPGDLLSNINRWREQIGLGAVDAGWVGSATTEIKVDGMPSTYVQIVDENAPKSTLVAVVPKNNRTWFIKFSGDADVVSKEKSNFEQFLESITLPR